MSAKTLLVGTRKGLIEYRPAGGSWKTQRISHAGNPVEYAFHDARSDMQWASLDHGHWGEKLHRSRDGGDSWEEVEIPKFPQGEVVPDRFGNKGATKPARVENIWVISPGADDQPNRMYLGTNPGGLFQSDDGGDSFDLVTPLWNHPSRMGNWFGGGRDTPGIHSIVVDPRDSKHLYVAISCAGVFESRDDGDTWQPRNKGLAADFLPDPSVDVGHDPHFIMACQEHPDVLWMQNHCGVFRTTDGCESWDTLHTDDGPVKFGFPVAAHATEKDTAWVIPGVSDEKRMTIDGQLCVYRTQDGGKSWQPQRNGLPQEHAYDVIYRHALDIDGDTLCFGSTTGNLYFSHDRGDSWECLSNNLPPVYSVRFGH